jgi:hypothetical protein
MAVQLCGCAVVKASQDYQLLLPLQLTVQVQLALAQLPFQSLGTDGIAVAVATCTTMAAG